MPAGVPAKNPGKEAAVEISAELKQKLLGYQKNEISEYHIYRMLARIQRSENNRRVLEQIAGDELRHYEQWRSYTLQDVKPDRRQVWKHFLICRVLGFTFGVKLMEAGEGDAQQVYAELKGKIKEADDIIREEGDHEDALVRMLDEERLRYTGSIVLGLNDALVELTGALAGLTLALRNTRLIALTGSITGIAAAMSMAASEYLSTKAEETEQNPLKASLYTGLAYVLTVIILILPYLLLTNYYLCLGVALTAAILIIAAFNYYIAVAKDLSFPRRFWEMTGLSFGVATLSFFIGSLLRVFLGVEI